MVQKEYNIILWQLSYTLKLWSKRHTNDNVVKTMIANANKHYSQTRPIAQMHAQHRKQTHIATDCSDLDVCLPTLLLQMGFEKKFEDILGGCTCVHITSLYFWGVLLQCHG